MIINRHMMNYAVLIILGVALLPISSSAATGKRAKGEFGFMVGRISGTSFEFTARDSSQSERYIPSDAAVSYALFFEQKSFGPMYMGATIEYHKFYQDWGSFGGVSSMVLNLSLRLSFHHISSDHKWSIRPGVASGVALAREIYTTPSSQYITLKPFVETVYYLSPKVGLISEVSILSSVWGQNIDSKITINPTVLARFGLLF